MDLLKDGLRLSEAWRTTLNLGAHLQEQLRQGDVLTQEFDIVSIGKASREMTSVTVKILGDRVHRTLIVSDVASIGAPTASTIEVVGEHPVPGERSLEAGRRVLEFLGQPSDATCTLFLVSGGASSLCALPQPPVTLDDLAVIWDSALETGANITVLNQLRAASSQIAGGAVLGHVRTARSLTLLMVDNVVSGAPWVASGLTYDYRPTPKDVKKLIREVALTGSSVEERVLAACRRRAHSMGAFANTNHKNVVIVEPSMVLSSTIAEARRLGYVVVDLGADIQGDVAEVAELLERSLRGALSTAGPVCVVGVGEATVRVRGNGVGGRCQELAWLMARRLSTLDRDVVFVARATDGQDFLPGVSGAWVDGSTFVKCSALNVDWEVVANSNDSYHGLRVLGQLLDGAHTGWNLCDLYLALV